MTSDPDTWSVVSCDIDSWSSNNQAAWPRGFRRAAIDVRPRHFKIGFPEQDEGDVKTLPELIDFNAAHNPNHIFCLQALPSFNKRKEGQRRDAFFRISHAEFRDAVLQCQDWLVRKMAGLELSSAADGECQAPKTKGPPVAVFMESEIGLLMHVSALAGLGVPILLLSARLSSAAIENLLRVTGAQWILTTTRLQQKAQEAVRILPRDVVKPSVLLRVGFEEMYRPFGDKQPETDSAASVSKPGHWISETDRAVIILHSSGTTGLPKPIYQPHRYLLGYAACHDLSEQDVVSKINLSTLPLYHGFGLLAPALAMSIGLTVCFPPSSIVPSAGSTMELLKLSQATSTMTVPSILEEISALSDETIQANLGNLQFVLWGGGPLKHTVREKLSNLGISLVNHSGATEIGALGSVFLPKDDEYDSRYIRFRRDLGINIRKNESQCGKPDEFTMTAFPFGWEEVFVLQDKLLTSPSGPELDFEIVGRNDDLIVLATGEKVLPQILERSLTELPDVKGALVFGEGQFEIGVLIEPMKPVSDVAAFRAQLWPTVVAAGSQMDTHGRLSSDSSVIVLAPGTLPRSDKGSVQRKEAYSHLEAQIQAFYQDVESHAEISGGTIDINSSSFSQDLSAHIVKSLGWESEAHRFKEDTDLFEFGMDSLQALRLRRELLSTILQKPGVEVDAIPKDFLYRHSTVAAIVRYIRCEDFAESPAEQVQKDLNNIVASQTQRLRDMPHGSCVLLTGSTGSLGAHLVQHLTEQDTVHKVICLVRKPQASNTSSSTPLKRQLSALSERELVLSARGLDKLYVRETKTSEPYLGLAIEEYRELTHNVTHILHNAWPVDFKRQLKSFGDQFDTLRELIHLAREVHYTRPSCKPCLTFVSSISTIAHFSELHDTNLVPEQPVDDLANTNRIGYAEAKLACEVMLRDAATHWTDEFDVRYVRVGQMSGSRRSGYWKSSEHFPALVKSSVKVGALPRLSGTLSWLPVDEAAVCMSELAMTDPGIVDYEAFHLENPVRQSWADVIDVFGRELGIAARVDLASWCDAVARFPAANNPAKQLLEFFRNEFEHNASGEVAMDTAHARQASPTLRKVRTIGEETVRAYVANWRKCGFLPASKGAEPEAAKWPESENWAIG